MQNINMGLSYFTALSYLLDISRNKIANFLSMQPIHAYLVAAHQQEISELESLLDICELVRLSSELIHALQAERGSANLYVAGKTERFLKLHKEKTQDTDSCLKELFAFLEPTSRAVLKLRYRSKLLTRIAIALDASQRISEIRSQVTGLLLNASHISTQYTQIVRSFLELIFEATDISDDPEVSKLLLALLNLIEAKESAGLERANGSRVLASEQINQSDQELLSDLIEIQELAVSHFKNFCGETLLVQWHALESTLPLAELERLRRKLLTNQLGSDKQIADIWFSSTTARLDAFHLVEKHLTELIKQSCLNRIEKNLATLADHTLIFSVKNETTPKRQEATDNLNHSSRYQQPQSSRINRSLLEMLHEQSEHLQRVSNELASVRAALEERKLIDRAKGFLMQQKGLTEEAAYNLLRQKAMQKNMRMSEIATSLLSMADMLRIS